MGSFGERLKREREMRGITLEEIAESTRVAKRHLVSLEQETFDQLPGGIFNKGFVRAYSKYLGIDQEQAVADYLVALEQSERDSGRVPVAVPETLVKPPAMPSDEAVERKNRMWVIAALIALVLGLGLWWYVTRVMARGEAPTPPPVQAASQPPQPAAQASEPPATSASQSSADSPAAGTLSQTNNPSGNSPAEKTSSSFEPSGTAAQSIIKGQSSPAPTVPAGSFLLEVHGLQNTWVSITADGALISEGFINQGASLSVPAQRSITLKTGNAAGIEMSFNGKKLPSLGRDKQVKTFTFTPNGLEQSQ